LGWGPADEDPIPVQEPNGGPPLFDFFGLGQPGQPPFNPGLADNEEENANNADFGGLDLALNPHPDAAHAAVLIFQPDDHEEQLIIDLNLEPDGVGLIDLEMGEQDDVPDLNEDLVLDDNANHVMLHPENAQIIPFVPQVLAQDIPQGLEIDLNEEPISMVIDSFQDSSVANESEVEQFAH
jgi:hypothetical protein